MKIKRHCRTSAAGDTSGYESAEHQTEKPCMRLLTKAKAGLGIGCYSVQLNKEITVEGPRYSLNANFVVCLLRVCSQTLPHQAKASSGDKCKSSSFGSTEEVPTGCCARWSRRGHCCCHTRVVSATKDTSTDSTPTAKRATSVRHSAYSNRTAMHNRSC
ncbi:hypothetical protein GQ600_5086 [Phytophthora cactorum]|nr:hypothetical protein GQ600_5086 [Phytophthora cactorum]